MKPLKFKFFLFAAVFMFAAKPFVGFSFFNRIQPSWNDTTILVKAFTKRKQEYVEDSEFDIISIQQHLANPVTQVFLLFSFFLKRFFSTVSCSVKTVTNHMLTAIQLGLFPPQHRYLLGGKLII